MNDREIVEKTLAGSEARQAVGRRPPSSSAEAVDVAVRKHLAAEEYFARHHRELRQRAATEPDKGASKDRAEEMPGR